MPCTRRIRRSAPPVAALLLGALALVAPQRPASGQEENKYTVIAGTGQSLFRIAIAPVLDGGGAARPAQQLRSVMTRDMELSGLFKVLDPKGFLANLAKEGTGVVVQDWINVGAQGVIKARARKSGNKVSVDFYLYDVGKGDKPVLSKTYSGSERGVRRLAHRFGNDVVEYYTGEPGVFLSRIAFASGSKRAKRSYIYVMDYDGHGVYRASRTGPQNVLPDWSPRGQLAYTSFLWRNPDLYVVDGSGGRAQRVSKQPGLNTGAAWSPKGDLIALTLTRDGNAEIYLITPQGKIVRRLTNDPAIDTSPTWSPDGSQIAFVSSRAGTPQIYVMSASGGGARRLTYQGSYNQEPDWCPRKETPLVAFTARAEGGNYDVLTIDVKTGKLKRLTQGQGSNMSPSWSPDGRLIVFSSSRGGLWLMNSEGLNQHQVYRGGGSTPDWSF